MGRKFARNVALILALAAMATAMTGCVVIQSQSGQQLNTIGDPIQLTTTACFSGQTGCPDLGNSGQAATRGFQILLGYRIPAAADAPQSITTVAGQPLTFNSDPSYASELERLAPTGPNQQWVGYRTANIASTPSSPTFTVSPTFDRPEPENGAPLGPFDYRVVTGARQTPSPNPDVPVACGSSLTDTSNASICVDSPQVSDVATNLEQPNRDLGVLDDSVPVQVNQGDVARLPFLLAYFGDGANAPTFTLSASTDVAGTSATLGAPTITPNAGPNRVNVGVSVPLNTAPGDYDVTLTASLPNGQTRSSTHELHVNATALQCNQIKPTIVGTPGPDVLVGTPGPDVIDGYGGGDKIYGLGGNDVICGGGGNDVIYGGAGNDRILGQSGNDRISGGSGHNLLDGGVGHNVIIARQGHNVIIGRQGHNVIIVRR